jgi:hypothetical protein
MLKRRAIRTKILPRLSFLLLGGASEFREAVCGTSVVEADGRRLIRRRGLLTGGGEETVIDGSSPTGVAGAECISGCDADEKGLIFRRLLSFLVTAAPSASVGCK